MKLAHYALALVFASTITLAQTSNANIVVVSSSKAADVKPDSVVFTLSVDADPTLSIEDVVQSLSTLGITADDLQSISPYPYAPQNPNDTTTTKYLFAYTVPFAKLKATTNTLDQLRTSLKNDKNIDLSYFITEYVVAPGVVNDARRKVLPDLIADARSRAQDIAKAAGVSLGAIVSISDSAYYGAFGAVSGAPGGYYSSAAIPRSYIFYITVSFAIQ
jgi:uncharacterized protein YggE